MVLQQDGPSNETLGPHDFANDGEKHAVQQKEIAAPVNRWQTWARLMNSVGLPPQIRDFGDVRA